MSIEVRGLTKRYGPLTVIDDLSLRFASGRISVLLGPSGCGKTTTLRCIAGLEDPAGGEILIEGKTVFDAARGVNLPPERRDIGMVFQSYAIWPHMTVFENVALPLKARGATTPDIARRVNETLATVGLEAMADRSATKLSGGQQQRVALARCLASHPKLILLDEPLSNLDAKLRVEMRAEIKDLQRKLGATMLFVTHDQEEALSLADEIFLFDRGRVVQSGGPRDLYFRPRTRFAAEFLGKANLVPVTIEPRGAGHEVRARDSAQTLVATVDVAPPALADPCAMVRPEAWIVVSETASPLQGTVTDATFIGDRLVVRIDTPIGPQIVGTSGFESLAPGDRVGLRMDASRLQLIDRDEGRTS